MFVNRYKIKKLRTTAQVKSLFNFNSQKVTYFLKTSNLSDSLDIWKNG